jgi:hypothetical protein
MSFQIKNLKVLIMCLRPKLKALNKRLNLKNRKRNSNFKPKIIR